MTTISFKKKFSFNFRNGFDVVAPPFVDRTGETQKQYMYTPARRKFLLSFQGEYRTSKLMLNSRRLSRLSGVDSVNDSPNIGKKSPSRNSFDSSDNIYSKSRKLFGGTFDDDSPTDEPLSSESLAEDTIIDILKKMQLSDLGDNFFFQFSCTGPSPTGLASEWLLCGSAESRLDVLEQSTFTLLIGPLDYNLVSTPQVCCVFLVIPGPGYQSVH